MAEEPFNPLSVKKSVQAALLGKGKVGVDSRGEFIYPSPAELKKEGPAKAGRIRTGIAGFDALVPDGIYENAVILVSGATGTCKTLFCLQFLVAGALRGEPGIFLSFEQDAESIRQAGRNFGWDIDRLEAEKKLLIVYKDPAEVKEFSKTLAGELHYSMEDLGARRAVIDSITYFAMTVPDQFQVRQDVASLARRLREVGCLTLMTAELPEQLEPGRLYVEDFVADGVVHLYNLLIRDIRSRAIEVLKMRNTRHDSGLHPFTVAPSGIEIFPEEQVFKE